MADELEGLGGAGGGTEAAATPTSTPAAAPTPGVAPTPGEMYELTVNGKRVQIAGLDKLREHAQKGYHYTQSMQELGEQRRQFQSEREEFDRAVAEARAFLTDRARVRAYLQELDRQAGEQPPAGAGAEALDGFLTKQDVQRMLEEERQRMAGMTQQEIARVRAQFEVEQLAGTYSQQLNAHLGSLVGQYPELKGLPRLDRVIKEAVAEMNPRSVDEAKMFMAELAGQWASGLREQLMAERKKVEPPVALTRGIEPPGGAGPMPPAAPSFKRVDDPGFKEAVMRELMETMKPKG